MTDLLEDILKHIPDNVKLSDMKESDKATINLIKSYESYAEKNSKLISITGENTGAEFKQALRDVDPMILISLLHEYQKGYLMHLGQKNEDEEDSLIDKKTTKKIVVISSTLVVVTLCIILLFVVIVETIEGRMDSSMIFKETINFFKDIINLFIQSPSTAP